MRGFVSVLVVVSSLFVGCEPADPASPDGGGVEPGEPSFPPGLVITPDSQLARRLSGDCIPFDPFGDGRWTCIMTTPQDGTLGALSPEGEALPDAAGGTASPLLDEPPTPLPGRVDHRSQYLDGCVTISNQQACGWCVVHAATTVLEALHCSKGCDVPELSEAHLRSNSDEIRTRPFGSCAEGWWAEAALDTLVRYPIVDNATWPYVANGRGLNETRPSDAVLAANAVYQPTGSHAVDPRDLDALKGALASEREILIEVPVFRDIVVADPNTPGDCESGTTATHRDWCDDVAHVGVPPTAKPCGCNRWCTDPMCLSGYHAIVLTGYDDTTREFTFQNSWGKEWGDGGYGTMSYDFATTYIRQNGAAVLDDLDTTIPGNGCEDDMGELPADRCGAAGDCAACTALSGCGWCDGTGCIADADQGTCVIYYPNTCPRPAADPCGAADCASCVATDGCDWCSWGDFCFSPSARTAECWDPRNAPDQCDDCDDAMDCASCAAREGCGFCPNQSRGEVAPGASPTGDCVTGSATAPDRAECGAYRGTMDECTADECSLIDNCTDCLDRDGCGWCDGTDQCMFGRFRGPVGDEYYGSTCGDDWDWFSPFCDNTDASCAEAASCRECLRSGSACEWDETNLLCADVGTISMSGYVISAEGNCPPLCNGAFAPCESSDECCDGLACVNGDCVDCGGAGDVGEGCDGAVVGACCGSLVCSESAGGGGTTCCRSDRDACGGDAECCGEMLCVMGHCACRASGESCQTGRECCGSSFCDAGTCT